MDDLISRQAAIDALVKWTHLTWEHLKIIYPMLNVLEELPSAERRGRWEMKEDPYGFFDTIPVCSACGCTTKYRVTSAYCPNCGARMDEVEE